MAARGLHDPPKVFGTACILLLDHAYGHLRYPSVDGVEGGCGIWHTVIRSASCSTSEPRSGAGRDTAAAVRQLYGSCERRGERSSGQGPEQSFRRRDD